MAASSVSMAIASVTAWFTPTVLFCAANLIIATIFIGANRNNRKHHGNVDENSPNRNSRVSSFFDRVRSMNSSSYSATTTTTAAAAEESQQQQYSPRSTTSKYSSLSRLAQSIHLTSNELSDSKGGRQPLSQPAHSPLFGRVKSVKFASDYNQNSFPANSDETDDSPGQLVLFDRVKSQPETVDTDPSDNTEHHHHVTGRKSAVKMKKSRSEMRIETRNDVGKAELRRPATARERRNHEFDEEVDARADDFISKFKQHLNLQRLESFVRFKDMLNRGR